MGIVHRDLKPQNIMIDRNGSAKIMDFGIARSLRERGITGPSVMIGTPEYMSPEQAEAKEVDHRSDIYSLGVILYEMATSRVPFEGETALSIAMKHKAEAPKSPKQLNPSLPDDLSGVILKCLEKDRAKRYQNAADLGADLGRIEKGLPTTERVVPERKPLTSRDITVKFNLRKLFIPAAVVVALLVLALVVWRFIPRKKAVPTQKIENSVAVISFENQTGDRSYDYLQKAIANLLITNLEQSGNLYVATWERMRDLLKQLKKDNVETITPDLGFELRRLEEMKSFLPKAKLDKDPDYFYLRAEILLAEGKAREAISLLTKAPPKILISLSYGPTMVVYNIPFLQDTLARAYEQNGEIDKAIAEYERLTSFRMRTAEPFLVHPKYHYRLATPYEQKGLKAKAAEQYRRSLDLWKDADPGWPEVEDAKARLAQLGTT